MPNPIFLFFFSNFPSRSDFHPPFLISLHLMHAVSRESSSFIARSTSQRPLDFWYPLVSMSRFHYRIKPHSRPVLMIWHNNKEMCRKIQNVQQSAVAWQWIEKGKGWRGGGEGWEEKYGSTGPQQLRLRLEWRVWHRQCPFQSYSFMSQQALPRTQETTESHVHTVGFCFPASCSCAHRVFYEDLPRGTFVDFWR